uniref:SpoIIE family protein phosphatase n=1 Tax=Actinacidiphila guanduensis TaxID=310781 RepID=UPI001FEBD788|nr:SpoIIE family protein phosphatase [Actinacidiphila guanduensis]
MEEHAALFPIGTDEGPLADWVLSWSSVALAVHDADLRCVRENAAMHRLGGEAVEPGAFAAGTRCRLASVLADPDRDAWITLMRRVLRTGEPETDFRVRARTGTHPDHERVLSISVSPLRQEAGRVPGVCTTVVDVTDQQRDKDRLTLLNEASTRIGSTLDVMRTAQELADVIVPAVADFVAVDLLEALLSGDELSPLPITGAPALRRSANASVRSGVPEAVVRLGDVDVHPERSPSARVLRSGRSMLSPDLASVLEDWANDDPVRGASMRKHGFHSGMIVPIIARGTTLGVLLLARSANEEPFDAEDLSLVEELVARAAVCLDNARRFTRERSSAVALQQSLLPQWLPELSAVEAASRYLPAAPRLGVGGDWFDVIPLSGARVALVVGDVVGHGLQAAATMGRLRTAVRTLADVELAPDELLTHLDDLVLRLSAESETGRGTARGEAGDIGATCLYAVYDPVSGCCSLARAGHPPPAVVRPDGSAEFLDLPAGPPLGLGGLPFEAREVELPEGSLLALYTDGLVESREYDVDVGLESLRQALVAGEENLEDLCDGVVARLLATHRTDDAALLLARLRRLDTRQVAAWDLPTDPAAVPAVRADALHTLADWGLEEEGYVTELVVSELVTNAIRYGGDNIRLRLIRDRALICEVADTSSTAPHMRRARANDEGGRGLLLVAQLTDRWGSRQTTTGKVIWCEQTLPESRY